MVRINKIYTKTGDDGSTSLVGGKRISKTDCRVSCYGDIDELNSWLGLISASCSDKRLDQIPTVLSVIQNELFDIGSELATPAGADLSSLPLVLQDRVSQLEKWIDEFSGSLPELRSFILPGGSPLTSSLHIARTVCRRAERSILKVHESEPVRATTIQYVNRLSDLLFSLARYSSFQLGQEEVLWVPAGSRQQT